MIHRDRICNLYFVTYFTSSKGRNTTNIRSSLLSVIYLYFCIKMDTDFFSLFRRIHLYLTVPPPSMNSLPTVLWGGTLPRELITSLLSSLIHK